MLAKTLESPLDCEEIQPVHPKGDQSWVFIGRTDVEAETPILWPPDANSWLIWKDPDAGKDWRQEEKGTTEDEMVEWHYQLNGHGFGWTPGVDYGQGGVACCGSRGHKESDMTERLNWTELKRRESFSRIEVISLLPIFTPTLLNPHPCYLEFSSFSKVRLSFWLLHGGRWGWWGGAGREAGNFRVYFSVPLT